MTKMKMPHVGVKHFTYKKREKTFHRIRNKVPLKMN